MSKKYFAYTILSALALVLAGTGVASAHGWFGGVSNATPEEIAQHQETMFENKAEFFGIGVGEIKNYWAEGKNFKEIAEVEGITQEQLQERMMQSRQEQMQNHIQALVDNGVISQEQADQRLQFMEERMTNSKMDRGSHRGFGMGFGR